MHEGLRVVTFVNRELRRGCQLLRNGANRGPTIQWLQRAGSTRRKEVWKWKGLMAAEGT